MFKCIGSLQIDWGNIKLSISVNETQHMIKVPKTRVYAVLPDDNRIAQNIDVEYKYTEFLICKPSKIAPCETVAPYCSRDGAQV